MTAAGLAPDCIHDLAPGTCSMCTGRGEEKRRRPDPAGYGIWFEARRHGRCSACDEPVEPGDRIRSDGEAGWLCHDCGEDPQ